MKVAVLGLGQRGFNYIRWIKYFRRDFEVSAVCDINTGRADYTAKKYGVERVFYSDDEFFAQKLADALIIATQDRDHYGHCIRAIDIGYKHILIEKPLSPDMDECERLNEYATAHGVTVVVCHVLRYSKYYRKIKRIIESGEIGDIVTIQHSEDVGYFHFAHSYARGNWRREDETSPMILAKCCHDLDILSWLVGKPAVAVSGFGGLDYFKAENAPEGAADRCTDCKVRDCKYNAIGLYITDPWYKSTFLKGMGSVVTGNYGATKADKYEALRTGPYGRCVFKCDNDVADHQIVNLLYEGGATASHIVNGCTARCFRVTNVFGTHGEIRADDLSGKIKVRIFGGRSYTVRTKVIHGLGHLDGDVNLIRGWCRLIAGEEYDARDVTFLPQTLESHRAAIASEVSRKERGRVIYFNADEKL